MTHASWGCVEPNCVACELELEIARVTHKMRNELTYQSTGWYINVGIKVGYKIALGLVAK